YTARGHSGPPCPCPRLRHTRAQPGAVVGEGSLLLELDLVEWQPQDQVPGQWCVRAVHDVQLVVGEPSAIDPDLVDVSVELLDSIHALPDIQAVDAELAADGDRPLGGGGRGDLVAVDPQRELSVSSAQGD